MPKSGPSHHAAKRHEIVQAALAESPTRSAAAKRLGVHRTTLHRWLAQAKQPAPEPPAEPARSPHAPLQSEPVENRPTGREGLALAVLRSGWERDRDWFQREPEGHGFWLAVADLDEDWFSDQLARRLRPAA